MNRRERIVGSSRQHGVLAVTTPLLIILIIFLTVLLLDGARLYAAKREMQSQVNAAALAAAFDAQGCGGLSVDSEPMVEKGLLAARSQGWQGAGEFIVEHGYVEFGQDAVAVFSPGGDLLRSNAVGASYKRSLPISLLLPGGAFGLDEIEISVSAVARRELVATISGAGSTAVVGGDTQRVTLLNALLGALFNNGAPYSFSATSLNDLADVTVRLGDLLVDSGAGGVVNALPVDARQLAIVLQGIVGGTTAAGSLLDGLLGNAVALEGISVEDVLHVVGDNIQVPENARVPVYDLLVSMAMNVLKDTLSAPVDIGLDLSGLATVSLQLYVGQPPAVVVGPARLKLDADQDDMDGWETSFDTADLKIFLNVGLLGQLAVLNVDLPLVIETGRGQGAFVGAVCAKGLDNVAGLYIRWATQAASIRTATVDATGNVVQADLVARVLGLPVALDLNATVQTTGSADQNPVLFEADIWEMAQPLAQVPRQSVGGSVSNINLKITRGSIQCGGLLDCVLQGLVSTVTGLLDATLLPLLNVTLMPLLTETIINPLLQGLGLELGRMDIAVSGVVQHGQLLEGAVFEND